MPAKYIHTGKSFTFPAYTEEMIERVALFLENPKTI